MKIPATTLEEAIFIVQRILAGTGIAVRADVQDEGAYLLIIAAIPSENVEATNKELLVPYERQLLQQLPALLKPKPDGDYSWMVVFTVKEKVIDAVMDMEGLVRPSD